MPATQKAGPARTDTLPLVVAGVVAAVWLLVAYAGFRGGVNLEGKGWAGLPLGLLLGKTSWTAAASWWLVGLLAGLLLVAIFCAWLWRKLRHSSKRTRVDDAARLMGRGADIEPITQKHAQEMAGRLHVQARTPGILIGMSTVSGKPLYGSWEDTQFDIWGPRTGKTTSRAIPAVMDAPGAVVATSNKRDLCGATRDPRAQLGQVSVFDSEGVVGEPAGWWWNPLSYVTDDSKASRLADHFSFASRKAGDKGDAYFDPAGRDLVADVMLGAALNNEPVTTVYKWLVNRRAKTPVNALKAAGYDLQADRLVAAQTMSDKQQDGVYGTALKMVSCLTVRSIMPWINPVGPHDTRPVFDPDEFVQGPNTLYALSKEGTGVAAPLVTALTVAVVEAAEKLATSQPGGRLSIPMLCCLDEAANVCKWGNLPDLYSHLGSRGILIMTFLQSWSQGVDTWTSSGMRKMWSAANIKVYGGGVIEAEFLDSLAKVIGQFDRQTSSTSTNNASQGSSSRSVSQQTTRARILDIEDLAAMPRGRALVIASGAVPTIVRTVPWMARPDAGLIRASIAAHEPK